MSREPAVVYGAIASLVVVLASIFNIVIEPNTVETVLIAVVPLISGLATRQKVTPVSDV